MSFYCKKKVRGYLSKAIGKSWRLEDDEMVMMILGLGWLSSSVMVAAVMCTIGSRVKALPF